MMVMTMLVLLGHGPGDIGAQGLQSWRLEVGTQCWLHCLLVRTAHCESLSLLVETQSMAWPTN